MVCNTGKNGSVLLAEKGSEVGLERGITPSLLIISLLFLSFPSLDQSARLESIVIPLSVI